MASFPGLSCFSVSFTTISPPLSLQAISNSGRAETDLGTTKPLLLVLFSTGSF